MCLLRCFLFFGCVGRGSGWAEVQFECKVSPKEHVPEEQVKRNAPCRCTCQTLVSYIRINWTDCNTGSMLPHRSMTLGEEKECPGSPRPPTSPSIGGFGCPQAQQASRVNYKGPASLRKITWAQWSIHARPPGTTSLRGAWAFGCYTAPGQ